MNSDLEIHDMTETIEPGVDRDALIDLVAAEALAHTDEVAELLLGFLVSMPDPLRVRQPAGV